MKKIILLAAIAVCSISSYAQVSFGAQIGANIGMGHTNNDDPLASAYTISNDPKVGFLVGVLAEVDFGKIAFRPELNFIQKGSKSGYSYLGFTSPSEKLTLNYVEIPLNVVYNLEIGKAGKVFFGLGPAIAIGLSGKDKYDDTDNNGNPITDHDVKFDGKKYSDITDLNDNNTHLKRVDVGASILAGYQLPMGVFAKLNYTLGFSDIDPNNNSKYKNRGFSICIGYMFGGGAKKK